MKKRQGKRKRAALAAVCALGGILLLGGCEAGGKNKDEAALEEVQEESTARLASDGSMIFGEPRRSLSMDELFDIDGETATAKEYLVFLLNTRNQYGDEFGNSIFAKNTGTTGFEEELRENVLNNLAQMKAMVRIAWYQGVSLTEEEQSSAAAAAHEYEQSLSTAAKEFLSMSEEELKSLYQEYALANKLYYQMTSDADTEVSDDEARVAVVQEILIKTTKNVDGTETEMTEAEKKAAFETAKEAWIKARDGSDFAALAEGYNDRDTTTDLTFSRGMVPQEVEDAVFSMENDAISDIIKTSKGYYIIKCIDSYDRELTDENKKTIIEKRQEEAFWSLYREFMDNAPSVFHEEAWEILKKKEVEGVDTKEFFEIYDRYFPRESGRANG